MFTTIGNFISNYLSPHQYLLESPANYNIGNEQIKSMDLNNPLVDSIKTFMEENNLYDNGIIVSLSGGVDSMVLFSCLLRLRIERYFSIYIVSINYNLRKESKNEAEFLKKFCRYHNVVYLVKDIENTISDNNQRGIYNDDSKKICKRSEFEEKSRDVRFDCYKSFIDKNKSNGVMVGHHKDDIIENIFTNSMKGHNILDIEVMKKIGIRKGISVYRPFLDFQKSDIYELAHQFGIPYFLDTTPTWSRRGRMRNEIFPLFDEIFTESWKKKFKEIGTQSNQWNDTIERLIIKPWFEDATFGKYGFSIPIKYSNDENLWIYSIPKLFFKINYGTIKKKTIVKLLKIINEESDETAKKPRIILDSGFRASIIENNLLIYHYSDILKNKELDNLTFDDLEEFNNLIN